ncbi:MAG: hypothetical protein J7K21_07555 [Desulfurococcales archaeon]|nr:hypothetical protein [Desulfurococcales archaeon]
MIVLVTGLLRYDAGKTTLVLELLDALKSIGFKPWPFKPIGAHNAWYQYETLLHSIDLAKLVGEDAYKLASAAGLLDEIEIISPVDILILPPDVKYFISNPRRYLDILMDLEKQAILARTTYLIEDKPYSIHYLVEDNYKTTLDVLKHDIQLFLSKIREYTIIRSNYLPELLSSPKLHAFLTNILNYIKAHSDIVVAESFNDAALPTPALKTVNYVAIVAPGKVLLFDGETYVKAVELYSSMGRFIGVDIPSIIGLLKKPLKTIDWGIIYGRDRERYREKLYELIDVFTRNL